MFFCWYNNLNADKDICSKTHSIKRFRWAFFPWMDRMLIYRCILIQHADLCFENKTLLTVRSEANPFLQFYELFSKFHMIRFESIFSFKRQDLFYIQLLTLNLGTCPKALRRQPLILCSYWASTPVSYKIVNIFTQTNLQWQQSTHRQQFLCQSAQAF